MDGSMDIEQKFSNVSSRTCVLLSLTLRSHDRLRKLRVHFLRKSKIGFFINPKESENGFCISLLRRSIQDLSYKGASEERKNPLSKWIL